MAKYLPKSEFEQIIVCTTSKGPVVDAILDEGVKIIPLGKFPSIWSITHYKKIARIIADYKPHIIHGAVFEGVTMAAITGFFCRVPMIILEETSDPKNRRWTGNFLLRMLSLPANHIVAISPSVQEYLRNNGIPQRKLRLIPNGVDRPGTIEAGERATMKAKLGLRQGDFVIGTVGRLRDFHKRFSDLIKAIALVQDIVPMRLLIIGDGTDRQMLMDLASNLGVSEFVIFAGYQFDTAKFYACMNVFSLASHMEGFGLVVIEAMLSNIPVVVTNVGGMRDIVQNDDTGILIEPFSPQLFADQWLRLYYNEQIRNELARRAFQMANSRYTSDAYIAGVTGLYTDAVNQFKLNDSR